MRVGEKIKNKRVGLFAFLFCSLIILTQASAETLKRFLDKGNFLLSGMIDVSNHSYSMVDWRGDTVKLNILTIEGTTSLLGFISKGFGIGGDFHIRHIGEEKFEFGFNQIGIGPKVAYFSERGKIYPFLSFGTHYLNYTSGPAVADGFRLKFSGGICAPFSGKAVFLIEAGYFYNKLFNINSFSERVFYLGLGIGGFITPNKE